ncbi:C6 zinc finger domain protein [Colletotrichum asianum]
MCNFVAATPNQARPMASDARPGEFPTDSDKSTQLEDISYPLDDVEFDSVTDEQLGRLFQTAPVLYQAGSNKIVRISQSLVLKGDGTVSKGEGETQRFAAVHGFPVPTVHRVFSLFGLYPNWPEEQSWFIVMDFVPGVSLEKAWPDLDTDTRDTVAVKVAEIIDRMQSLKISDMPPGPVDHGGDEPWRGPYFTEYGTGPFPTLQDMEDWYQHKLDVCIRLKRTSNETQRFSFTDVVLTHQDIAPRNLILQEGNQDLCLVDFGFGGIYPTGFEQAALARQAVGQWDVEFREMVLQKLTYRGEKELKQLRAIMKPQSENGLLNLQIKCDETKPVCVKCSATGRKCHGYKALTPARPARPQLCLAKSPDEFPGSLNGADYRAMQFFSEMVGPNLPGATDPYFWTDLVMQFTRFEPAVKHSVLAISALYEDVTMTSADATGSSQARRLRDNNLALAHYNIAIKHLLVMENKGLVVLVCLLFICIEILQSNREAALQHSTHGTIILGTSDALSYRWVKQWVLPLFRRLNTLNFWLGEGPDLPDLKVFRCLTPARFSNYDEAGDMIDDIFNQAFQILCQGYIYRGGSMRGQDPPPELLGQQRRIVQSLNDWHTLFGNLETRSMSTTKHSAITKTKKGFLRTFSLVRYHICRIWSNIAFALSEMVFDEHFDDYQTTVEEMLKTVENRPPGRQSKFEFEMGFIAPVLFLVMKCRYLSLRLKALRCLAVLPAPREALWERDGMYAVARRMVEIEHGVVLDRHGQIPAGVEPLRPGLPAKTMRVEQFVTETLDMTGRDVFGREVRGTKVIFFMRAADDSVRLVPDVLPGAGVELPEWSVKWAYDSVSSDTSGGQEAQDIVDDSDVMALTQAYQRLMDGRKG